MQVTQHMLTRESVSRACGNMLIDAALHALLLALPVNESDEGTETVSDFCDPDIESSNAQKSMITKDIMWMSYCIKMLYLMLCP